jgi:hypothetical protein
MKLYNAVREYYGLHKKNPVKTSKKIKRKCIKTINEQYQPEAER